MTTSVAVLGAGAWGTALCVHLLAHSAVRPQVVLWAREQAQVHALDQDRENRRYLPGIALPPGLDLTSDLAQAAGADLLLIATPMAGLPGLSATLRAIAVDRPLAWLAKGFVMEGEFPSLAHTYLASRWPGALAAVSGPSFAGEVARGLPTALTVASTSQTLAATIAGVLRGETLRVYESSDLAGVETVGAVKNVLAIAAGASDGLGFGHNARAALITRGLAETGRLTMALGGERETVMELAGLGDLVLTATGDESRNRRVGLALAQDVPLPAILADLGHVAEGVAAARAVRRLAVLHAIDMPICEAVDRVLHEGLPVRDAVAGLLRREPRTEFQ